MLTELFLHLVKKNTKKQDLANALWLEITTKYSESKRHYHTIAHLETMVADLNEVKNKITDWDTTLLALFYHDIIYKTSSNTNEEDSAKLAMKRLSKIGYPGKEIVKCSNMILATKKHEISEDIDTNYLTDSDIAILGKSSEVYQKYREQIRAEYYIFPDLIYNSGRKKVLQQFLQMKKIYKTEFFFKKYENQARINLKNELEILQ